MATSKVSLPSHAWRPLLRSGAGLSPQCVVVALLRPLTKNAVEQRTGLWTSPAVNITHWDVDRLNFPRNHDDWQWPEWIAANKTILYSFQSGATSLPLPLIAVRSMCFVLPLPLPVFPLGNHGETAGSRIEAAGNRQCVAWCRCFSSL
jgi:hypothetical protein